MANIIFNELHGLKRGFSMVLGGFDFECTALSVQEARAGWCKLQPMLRGLMASDELMSKHAMDIGPLEMAGITGGLNQETLDWLSSTFAKHTTVTASEGEARNIKDLPLSMEGAIDSVFAGKFDEYLEWIDSAIKFNFGAQISKQTAAAVKLTERAKVAAKAQPNELV